MMVLCLRVGEVLMFSREHQQEFVTVEGLLDDSILVFEALGERVRVQVKRRRKQASRVAIEAPCSLRIDRVPIAYVNKERS